MSGRGPENVQQSRTNRSRGRDRGRIRVDGKESKEVPISGKVPWFLLTTYDDTYLGAYLSHPSQPETVSLLTPILSGVR